MTGVERAVLIHGVNLAQALGLEPPAAVIFGPVEGFAGVAVLHEDADARALDVSAAVRALLKFIFDPGFTAGFIFKHHNDLGLADGSYYVEGVIPDAARLSFDVSEA